MAAIKEYETVWQLYLIRLAYFVSLSFNVSIHVSDKPLSQIGRGGSICGGSLEEAGISQEVSSLFSWNLQWYQGHPHMVNSQANRHLIGVSSVLHRLRCRPRPEHGSDTPHTQSLHTKLTATTPISTKTDVFQESPRPINLGESLHPALPRSASPCWRVLYCCCQGLNPRPQSAH